jgi:hypothetical protein
LADNRKLTIKLIPPLLVSFSFFAVAHEGHHKKIEPVTPETKTSLEEINERYLKDVKPIFERTCFNCHSSRTRLPWYQKVPGVKQLIQSDIHEAKMHLDMESDFPFLSHATPLEDLTAIDKEIQNNDMPPFRYRIMHSQSSLTDVEKEKVRQWVQFGKDKLKETTK